MGSVAPTSFYSQFFQPFFANIVAYYIVQRVQQYSLIAQSKYSNLLGHSQIGIWVCADLPLKCCLQVIHALLCAIVNFYLLPFINVSTLLTEHGWVYWTF